MEFSFVLGVVLSKSNSREPHTYLFPGPFFHSLFIYWYVLTAHTVLVRNSLSLSLELFLVLHIKMQKKNHLIFPWSIMNSMRCFFFVKKKRQLKWFQFYRFKSSVHTWVKKKIMCIATLSIILRGKGERFQHYNWKSLNASYQSVKSICHCQSHRK